jgi:F-type H+-transporting ATPase subunit delta
MRYAKALMQIGEAGGNQAALQQELSRISTLVKGNADLTRLVQNPLVPPAKKSQVFDAVLSQAGASNTLRNFFKVVAQAGRLNLLADMDAAFHELVDLRAGIVEAKVSSTQPLTEGQTAALSASLAQRTGKTVRLRWTEDQSLLGGLRVQVGSTVYDASLQGQLKQLKAQLLS